ncbi:uncharacterized protein MONBRDRAFT_9536 [Monosiga brevicollis MX1]|uniref:Uncharacterized protein n=1 Tax=Monosiga brevicollis TaxID=81824 RepID=A9V3M0_MONBE|nr:uncharacterized protein MONBRDRAFT_9536 [Monosiga brevicollis MX1]EDQ87838.1 predicted protein [Monosiga brevicollis MX1]|eukprot:XP_001747371.1 hypothetical protein [Monosiga brevicollis MX1]
MPCVCVWAGELLPLGLAAGVEPGAADWVNNVGAGAAACAAVATGTELLVVAEGPELRACDPRKPAAAATLWSQRVSEDVDCDTNELAVLDSFVVAVTDDGLLLVLDQTTGRVLTRTAAHDNIAACLTTTAASRGVLTGGLDGHVKLWALTPDGRPVLRDETNMTSWLPSACWRRPMPALCRRPDGCARASS